MSDATNPPTDDAPGQSPQQTDDVATAATVDTSDIAHMGYEQARDELASIVSTLESGRAPLEESMRLWERGEALADHCTTWLDGAQARVEEAVSRRDKPTG